MYLSAIGCVLTRMGLTFRRRKSLGHGASLNLSTHGGWELDPDLMHEAAARTNRNIKRLWKLSAVWVAAVVALFLVAILVSALS